MNGRLPPRAVVVTRATELEELLMRHGTRAQARFFLETRGQRLAELEERHQTLRAAVETVLAAIPLPWRRALVGRADLDRFLFEPEDVVLAVGQDGLVANVAKYVAGQIVVGINPSPALFEGVLVRHRPAHAAELMRVAAAGDGRIEERAMVEAASRDGQRLLALNEVFVGHRTHQSARYVLGFGGRSERHSSSGVVVATGTGATGWARSIARARVSDVALPGAVSRDLAFFVREAFPSVTTGTGLTDGVVTSGAQLVITSEMNDGGVAFGDGIEGDHLDLPWGEVLTVGVSATSLRLLVA